MKYNKEKKYIHYCWFGDKKLSRLARKCIKSWKKYLPEYEVVCWNEKNVNLDECPFIREAYQQKKWAFVADYVRAKVLYEYGGIYFDTDMMVKKDIRFLLDKMTFVGVEDSRYVNAAVWGENEPSGFLAGEILKFYRSQMHFNSRDLYAITIPVIMTRILIGCGYDKKSDNIQELTHGIVVYPREFFYPLSYDYENNAFTVNTCMVHYADATWASKAEKRDIKLIRLLGRKKAGIVLKIARSFKAMVLYYAKVLWRTIMLLLFPIRYLYRRICKSKAIHYAEAIGAIRKIKNHYVAFVHEGWLGVESSTRALFGDVVTIPDFDATSDVSSIAQSIAENNNINMVILSAFGAGWEYLAKKIKEFDPEVTVKVFWHGSNAMHIEGFDWDRFNTVFTLVNQGIVDSVAFAKKSMYEQYARLGYPVEFLPNNVDLRREKKKLMKTVRSHNGVRVGIYASGDRWVKNLYNQMAAVSLIDDVVLDMVPLADTSVQFAKLLKLELTGEDKSIHRDELLKRIIDDDIVLYATFVECAPILPLECLELGVLCITGDNHHYFDGTPLAEFLVEPKVDNPVAIAARIDKCLRNKDKILKLYGAWKKDYDEYCRKELKRFLDVS